MSIFTPLSIIQTGGYALIFGIVFAETGFLLGFLLPGDSLLFTAGFLASVGYLNIFWLILTCFAASVLGDNFSYALGKKYGHKVFKKQDSIFLHPDHIGKAEKFYKNHGGKTIIFARFLPFVRTAAPLLAGVGKMPFTTFIVYSLSGGALWTISFCVLGYYFGRAIPDAEQYVWPILLSIIGLSLLITSLTLISKQETRAKIWKKVRGFLN